MKARAAVHEWVLWSCSEQFQQVTVYETSPEVVSEKFQAGWMYLFFLSVFKAATVLLLSNTLWQLPVDSGFSAHFLFLITAVVVVFYVYFYYWKLYFLSFWILMSERKFDLTWLYV